MWSDNLGQSFWRVGNWLVAQREDCRTRDEVLETIKTWATERKLPWPLLRVVK